MISNKHKTTDNNDCNHKQGDCCHCCFRCFPNSRYPPGKCGICPKFNRKCPFGLDSEAHSITISKEFTDVNRHSQNKPPLPPKPNINITDWNAGRDRPMSANRQNGGQNKKNQWNTRGNSPRAAVVMNGNLRGSSVVRTTIGVPLQGSQTVHYRQPLRLVQSFITPVYIPPVIQIQPYYYSVTLPINLQQSGRARLINSSVRQSRNPSHQHSKQLHKESRESPTSFGAIKNSRSTFDRSKMKISLMMSNMSRNKEPPVHPDEMRNLVNAFSIEEIQQK